MAIYFIESVKIDTEKLMGIYRNGAWNSRGVAYYINGDKSRFFKETTTKWQGEHNSFTELSKSEFLTSLLKEDHPGRVDEGLEAAGLEIEEMEY